MSAATAPGTEGAPSEPSAPSAPSAGAAERRLAAGAVFGMLLAAAGTWLRYALEGTAVIDTSRPSFVAASAVAGVGLVLTGVCALRLAPRARALSWRELWIFALAAQLFAALGLVLTSADVYTNLCFGQLAHAGMSPYAHSPAELPPSELVDAVPRRWLKDPSPYGPLFFVFVRAAAWGGDLLGSTLWGSLASYKLILLASVLGALALASAHLRRTRPDAAAEVFVALGLGPVIAWEIPSQGHNDGLLVLALVAFFVAAERGRDVLAVAALAAGVAVKYALAPLLGLFLLLAARRSLPRAVGLGFVALAVVAAAFLPEARTMTLDAVLPMVGGETARHAHSFIDLVCLVLEALQWTEASRLAYGVLSKLSIALSLGLLVRAAWTSRTLAQLARGYLLFSFGLFLTTPWFQPWYVCWALPVLVVEADARWRRLLALYAVITVVQWGAPLDPVTTVAGNVWVAWRLFGLLRARGPEVAHASAITSG